MSEHVVEESSVDGNAAEDNMFVLRLYRPYTSVLQVNMRHCRRAPISAHLRSIDGSASPRSMDSECFP